MSGIGTPRRNRGERNARTPGDVPIGPGVPRRVAARSSAAGSAMAMAGPAAVRSRGLVL